MKSVRDNKEYKAKCDSIISEAGGSATASGRKMAMTYALQDYVNDEILNSGEIERSLNDFLFVIASNISSMAINLSHNGLFQDKEKAVFEMLRIIGVKSLEMNVSAIGEIKVVTAMARN